MSARSRTQARNSSALFNVIRALIGAVVLIGLFYVGWLVATEFQSFAPSSASAMATSSGASGSGTSTATSSNEGSAAISVSTTPTNPYASSYETGSEVIIDGNTIDVALSTTTAEIDQGLQYQPTLGSTDGMLFIFNAAKIYQFWMPNMSFPLDMIWIGSDMKVVSITRDAPPLPDPTKPVWFRPSTPAQYVLEVNANYAAAHNINVGDPVQFVSVPL